MNRIIQVIILIIFLNTIGSTAQNTKDFVIPDSLAKVDYEILSKKYYEVLRTDNHLAKVYAKTYLQKGKNDRDPIKIGLGYSFMGYTFNVKTDLNKQIKYLDSAIAECEGSNHKRYPLLFYISKGAAFENVGNFKKALDNFLYAVEFAKQIGNKNLEVISNHNIALVKIKLGKYEEAKTILQKCLVYEKGKLKNNENDPSAFFLTLSDLVNVYRLNNQIDSAFVLNNLGMNLAKNELGEDLFKLNEGILKYYEKEYKVAIDKIEKSIPDKQRLSYLFEDYNAINAYLYLAKSYEGISNRKKAVYYYKKIDSLLKETNYIIPESRTTYLSLINYYKSIKDKNQQLFYINRLLYMDSILDNNYKYLSNKLNKDYDTPELLSEKEKLIENLEAKQNNSFIGVIILSALVCVILIFLILSYKKQKRYQRRFEELMMFNEKEDIQKAKEIEKIKTLNTSKSTGISDDIVNNILDSLENFESKQGFLKINITTSGLASSFGTNSKYLSKVINTYKKKSFIQYINDLRIEFIIEKLKNDNKFRMYTIKALASEAGFNTTEAFSKSFYKKTGIYPSYFIKQFEKQKKSNNPL